jgi:hypothetical protein
VMNLLEVTAAARKGRGHASRGLGLCKHALEPIGRERRRRCRPHAQRVSGPHSSVRLSGPSDSPRRSHVSRRTRRRARWRSGGACERPCHPVRGRCRRHRDESRARPRLRARARGRVPSLGRGRSRRDQPRQKRLRST